MNLYNASAVLPSSVAKDSSIVVSQGRIDSVGTEALRTEASIDCTGLIVVPGFIDVHIHGALGVDVNAADLDGLIKVASFLGRNGVTAWMPTLVPDSDECYERTISTIDRLMEIQEAEPIAQAVGVHYEGVFANEKMCGALRRQFFKKFTGGELAGLPRLKRGVHMTTFAPEIDGGVELAKELTRQDWIASIGHTKAGVETLNNAFDAGASHVTHFYNAMTGLHHRDVGVVGWALTNPGITFDIIADGIHVDPRMLEFACRIKGPSNVSLISDAVAPTGLGDGEFEIWGEKVTVEKGRTQNERGSIAGSVITMLDAVKGMLSIGFTQPEVSGMASLNPTKLLKIDTDRGSIEIGKRADLVALDSNGNVKLTIIGGRVVFDGRS
ncbi:MAG: N-acetylglucosamine-6-phosphate deacetylase [Acidobacteriota bacterium]